METGPQVLGNHKAALPVVTYFYSAVIHSLRSLHIPRCQAGMALTVVGHNFVSFGFLSASI
eukprot:scaffold134782_cov24-Attheya_sp.AAC.1